MRLAIDIGYSNLKGYSGVSAGASSPFCLPAGAGPAEKAAVALRSEHKAPGVHVMVGGREWLAGLEPGLLAHQPRELHRRYTESETYMALYRAALERCGTEEIERVVTGLPVSQYLDKTLRSSLKETLCGNHPMMGGRTVSVRDVRVVPQAVGAYLDYAATGQWRALIDQGRVLVVDVGFFSVDWALLDAGAWQQAASGSSVHAFSRVLEEVSRQIYTRHNAMISPERIERAVRGSNPNILIHGESVALSDFWSAAVREVAPTALTELERQLRIETDALDLILLTGGGAASYLAPAREVFPRAKVDTTVEPVLSNARGYWGVAWR
jgi:plasmid segregation protein ParM